MADYRLTAPINGAGFHTIVIRTVDGTAIVNDPKNTDYQAYLAWVDAGNTADAYVAPPPTVADVAAERDRRLALGFDYTFNDVRGTQRIGTTPDDMVGWDEVTKWSLAAMAMNQSSATLQILTNTAQITVTALEWQQVLMAATAARQPLWSASFVLEAANPIPSDYTADSYWR